MNLHKIPRCRSETVTHSGGIGEKFPNRACAAPLFMLI